MKGYIALVYMDDEDENFFIEDPPKGNPETWIDRFAYPESVEHVIVFERGETVHCWANPNVSEEQ